MYVPLGVTGHTEKVGVDQNWKFTLWFVSYTCWKSQDFPTPPIQEKRENILQLNIIEYYSLFDFENSISANCIEGTLQFAWRTEGMKKKERISEPIHFQFRDLSSSARCWHYSCSIFLLLFFGIEESSFSIQTNFLSHSQLGMIWLGLGSSSRARSVEMGGIFLGICLSLAAASRVELKGYEKEAPSIWPMRCKCQFSTP